MIAKQNQTAEQSRKKGSRSEVKYSVIKLERNPKVKWMSRQNKQASKHPSIQAGGCLGTVHNTTKHHNCYICSSFSSDHAKACAMTAAGHGAEKN
jgi:hypothetical protein